MEGFLAGSISGFVQILIGHPFDTYKIWLQTGEKKNHRYLYNGIKYPLYTNCLVNSILFGSSYNLEKKINNPFLTGFLTGIATSFICCPVELLKIREQCLLSTPKSISQWYRGFNITLLRESISCSLYIGIYDYCYKREKYNSFISGGISGVSSWLFTHPIDTIKTRIQRGQINSIYQGINSKNLWNGLSINLLRAIIVNSCGFYIYQYSIDKYKKYNF